MTEKKLKTVRRTVVVVAGDDIPVSSRALQWELASKSASRRVYRVERATAPSWCDQGELVYLIDIELTCKGANRHDFTKFVQSYLPEVEYHYITD